MGVLVVQYGPAQRPPAVGAALETAGLEVRACRVGAGDPLPSSLAGVQAVVVAGGPDPARGEAEGGEGFPGRADHVDLLRQALAAEVPVLGVRLGARLLAEAAGGRAGSGAGPGAGPRAGWGAVRVAPAAGRDPLFACLPRELRVPHGDTGAIDLPDGAVLLASCDRYPVQAFRVGGAAWGVRFALEEPETDEGGEAVADPVAVTDLAANGSPVIRASAAATLAGGALGPHRERLLGRFAALVAGRAAHTATRTFFAPRATGWEQRFAADGPAYAAAVARMGLRPGQTVLDLGCGTGRALPELRAAVGDSGRVLGIDVTAAMLATAARAGRAGAAGLLLADCHRLPLPPAAVDAVFSAGLLDHLPVPAAGLREWARATAPGGTLLLFHPSTRAEHAARHGHAPRSDDLLARPHLAAALAATGWRLREYEDAAGRFVAAAVRVP
ncbi:GMP synthase-Glutamine amidotransferase [Actinacidiphila yanglinensis]|uniref:GMP synthase-Glutamine amidotransferase n=1 Tax=Actinacidiphila yanglinensis TaxID=310779 RepID=A0A1H6CV61_9ACTN|nr:methyltransferase domain-containing protein [Actinacidiphila yanglinensis]SEG76854.1 GMP synthase-Glutamine amidotransferase [Actinacidiphila yanglinensis]